MARRKTIKLGNLLKPKKSKKNPISKAINGLVKGAKSIEKKPYGPMGWW